MVDDVGGRGIAAGTAEPLATRQTSDDRTGIMDTAIPGQIYWLAFWRQLLGVNHYLRACMGG